MEVDAIMNQPEAIQVLYLDDDVESFCAISRPVASEWKALCADGPELVFTQLVDPTQAMDTLRQSDAAFPLLIADLLFPPMGRPDAPTEEHEPYRVLDVIREAANGKRVIVGISRGKNDRFKTLHEDVIKAGADIFRYVIQLGDLGGMFRFCSEIREKLLAKGIVQDGKPLCYDRNDPRIVHLVEETEAARLKALYRKCLPDELRVDDVSVSYVAPGMSGAYVLKIDASTTERGRLTHLLKVSRNKTRLENEIENFPRIGPPYASRLLVDYLAKDKSDVVNDGDWHAIAARFESSAIALKKWLAAKNVAVSRVDDVLSLIFLEDGLRIGYATEIDTSGDPEPVTTVLLPNASRRSRIVLAMEELGEAIKSQRLGKERNWPTHVAVLRRFLKEQRVGDLGASEISETCQKCFVHGDLHTRNILISQPDPPVPVIIDWSDCGPGHWASDVARFLVDLLVCVYDGGVNSFLWEKLHLWRELAECMTKRQQLVHRFTKT